MTPVAPLQTQKNHKLIAWLVLACLVMFGFGFAMVPLYDTFCKVTGLNGKTDGRYKLTQALEVDSSRTITIQFITHLNQSLNWDFYTQTKSVTLHPGEIKQVIFYAKNKSDHRIVSRAIPSVSPGIAAEYLHKTECFCFNEQPLASKHSKAMPLVFFIDPSIPNDIHEMTLSYTLFDTQKT
jgi:cytochrome c oxidase assembly protein subunit 11